MTRTKEKPPDSAESNHVVDTAAPPCQEEGQPDGLGPQEPHVTTTRTLRVQVTRRHNVLRPRWTEFCAAVAALADKLPPGVDPEINIRAITVSWEEKA